MAELRAIEEAFVPVIKFRYNGIEIDMTFSRLNMNELPPSGSIDHILLDHNTMLGMADKCIRSLNGYRSTMELLRLVSDKEVKIYMFMVYIGHTKDDTLYLTGYRQIFEKVSVYDFFLFGQPKLALKEESWTEKLFK